MLSPHNNHYSGVTSSLTFGIIVTQQLLAFALINLSLKSMVFSLKSFYLTTCLMPIVLTCLVSSISTIRGTNRLDSVDVLLSNKQKLS